jgi:hypothetical protein
VYTAGSGCANVACHGGKATPPWNTATYTNYVYDPTGANCTLNCHTVVNTLGNVAPTPYINVYNGDGCDPTALGFGAWCSIDIVGSLGSNNQHDFHINQFPAALCTDCHSITKLQTSNTHFSGLPQGQRQFVPGDPTAAGFAANTIGGAGTKVVTYTYDSATPSPPAIPRGGCDASCHPGPIRYWFLK